jgi:hypothetical protein
MDINDILAGLDQHEGLQNLAAQAGVSPDQAQSMIGDVIGHLAGGGSADALAGMVAQRFGVDPSLVQQLLPALGPLLQGHAEAGGEGLQGALGGLLGSVGGIGGLASILGGLSGGQR